VFTGIIEELGRIASLEKLEQGMRLNIACSLVVSDARDGDSIAVNGVCLTALNVTGDSFAADVSPETLDRSTLGSLTAGSPVNLERAVTPQTRLGGHSV
jgi:riboflavin synthase